MTDINEDVSTLTTIPKKTLDRLNPKILYSICETIQENILDENYVAEFNFYDLFTLYIKYDDKKAIKYRIVPSPTLEKAVSDTVKKKLNLLEDTLNLNLVTKFNDIYKNLC